MDPFEEMHFLLKMGIIHFLVNNGFKGRILNYPVTLGEWFGARTMIVGGRELDYLIVLAAFERPWSSFWTLLAIFWDQKINPKISPIKPQRIVFWDVFFQIEHPRGPKKNGGNLIGFLVSPGIALLDVLPGLGNRRVFGTGRFIHHDELLLKKTGWVRRTNTPQKFNMEPEQKSLEKEIPFANHHFSGSMLNFGGVTPLLFFEDPGGLTNLAFFGKCWKNTPWHSSVLCVWSVFVTCQRRQLKRIISPATSRKESENPTDLRFPQKTTGMEKMDSSGQKWDANSCGFTPSTKLTAG